MVFLADHSSVSIKYSAHLKKIWLENKNRSVYKLVKQLEKNSGPELIGAEDSIRFVSRNSFRVGKVQYFGITFSERSMRGSGGGQCGAGAEEYFVAYEYTDQKIKEIFRILVGSCVQGIILDSGDGNNNDYSITSSEGVITFRWLTYPGTDLYKIARYSFEKNHIEYEEISKELANFEQPPK